VFQEPLRIGNDDVLELKVELLDDFTPLSTGCISMSTFWMRPSVASSVKPGSWIEWPPSLMCSTEIRADRILVSLSARLWRRDDARSNRFVILMTPRLTFPCFSVAALAASATAAA
jgi:hypothetical protein